MTESVFSGAPGGEDVLEDDLSYRSSAPMISINTPVTQRSLTTQRSR
jgi:hypothetical protein